MIVSMPTTEPPTRMIDELVVLERAHVGHLDGLQAAVETSHVELRDFMDWVEEEPQTREASRDYLEERSVVWDLGEEFGYAMVDPTTAEVIGMCSLMTRQGPGRLEIGYWVRSDRAGAGVATAAAALLTDAGLALDGIDAVQIHHDAANGASGRVAEKLGYTETSRRDVEIDSPGEVGVEVIWTITRAARP